MPTHAKTTKSFAEKSDQYIREDCTEPPLADDIKIQELLGDVSSKAILCVGCGAGAECFSLSSRGASVEGVDSSEALLKAAKHKCPDLKFELGTIENLPYPDGKFDIVYCAHVLHYMNEWNKALTELCRVSTNTGKIVVTIHHPADQGYTGDEPKEIHAKWYEDFDVVYYPRSISTMRRSFENSGLKVVKMFELQGEVGHPPLTVAFALKRA